MMIVFSFFVVLWLLIGLATYCIARQLKEDIRDLEIERARIERGELY